VLLDPQTKHYYQPLWTLVGGGVVSKETTERSQQSLIPKGADWIQEAVEEFNPEVNQFVTKAGTVIQYEILVVAAGIQVDWERIKGLKECIGRDGVCSNYDYRYVDSTWKSIRQFRGGNAIFTQPNSPIKCGGAPQKIMYLADDAFRQAGIRNKTNIIFASGNASIFAVPKYAAALNRVIERKDIATKYQLDLISIDSVRKEAVFEHVVTKERETLRYDMIHVVPPMSSPDFIRNSPLAGAQDGPKSTNIRCSMSGSRTCSRSEIAATSRLPRREQPSASRLPSQFKISSACWLDNRLLHVMTAIHHVRLLPAIIGLFWRSSITI